MNLTRSPNCLVKLPLTKMNFASDTTPSPKITFNINAFNGNTTIFGKK